MSGKMRRAAGAGLDVHQQSRGKGVSRSRLIQVTMASRRLANL
jgi:hypothetical protein